MAISTIDSMAAFCHDRLADIIALQEINVNPASATGFVSHWRAKGYLCILGGLDPSCALHRVALLARCPIQHVQLPVTVCQSRCAAGFVEIFGPNSKSCILLASFYGQSGDLVATDMLFRDFLQAAQRFGGPFVVMGDFNCTLAEAPVAPHLASGNLRCLDDDLPSCLPCTNPVDTRRIDFALAHRSVIASGGDTVRRRELSDHGIVSYNLDLSPHPAGHQAPRFAALTCTDPTVIEQAFESFWDPTLFASRIKEVDVEGAWQLLSDTAEMAMGADLSLSSVRRSRPWLPQPLTASRHRCDKDGHHSATVHDLQRLRNRVHQLRAQPHLHGLRRKILRSLCALRGRIPDFPFVSLANLDCAAEILTNLCNQFTTQEKDARVQSWRDDHYRSSQACFRWIRQRSRVADALQTASADEPARAIHPAEVVRTQGSVWTAKWNPASPVDFTKLEQLLGNFRCRPADPLQITLTARQLKRACAQMNGKAPGPDAWTAVQLGLLPQAWWDATTCLWNVCIQSGVLPNVWSRATIALVPKRLDETRPIALCSIVWRMGARCIAAALRPWCETWCGHNALGAAPGRSAACAHARLLLARTQGCSTFVQQDLSAFFDSLDVHAVCALLRRFGAPHQVCTILQTFYACPLRIFRVGLWVSKDWIYASRGLLQGCPLSPLLSLLVGTAWSLFTVGARDSEGFLHVGPSDTDNVIFVDDRVLWPTSQTASPLQAVRAALNRSDEFDSALALHCRSSKCAVAAVPGVHVLAPLAQQRNYNQTTCLQVLGISFDLGHDLAVPLRFSLKKLLCRLRMLRVLNPCLEVKRIVVQSLVFAAMFWATGVASVHEADLLAVRQELRSLLSLHATDEAPWVLIAAGFGWQWDPLWMRDWAALRAAWRFAATPPAWTETVPLTEACVPWTRLVPEALQVITRLGWYVSVDGRCISRTDDLGVTRSVHVGWDSIGVMRQWLVDAHQLVGIHRCGRIATSLHREDPTCARGLALAKPATSQRYALSGHHALSGPGPLAVRRAALASAGTGWYWTASLRLSARDTTCMCQGRNPSRPHVTWVCPHTAHCRLGLAAPQDRVSERLFAAPLREWPSAPPAVDQDEFVADLAEHCAQLMAKQSCLIVATDGSAFEGVGAFAIVTEQCSFATGDSSEDQSAFRQEALAFLALFRALCTVSALPAGRVTVLYDCTAVAAAIARPCSSSLPGLFSELASLHATLQSRGCPLELVWVPSHDKQASWCPPVHLCARSCRRLNAIADKAANDARINRWRPSARRSWFTASRDAHAWELAAIRAAAGASDVLKAHLQQPCSEGPLPFPRSPAVSDHVMCRDSGS